MAWSKKDINGSYNQAKLCNKNTLNILFIFFITLFLISKYGQRDFKPKYSI